MYVPPNATKPPRPGSANWPQAATSRGIGVNFLTDSEIEKIRSAEAISQPPPPLHHTAFVAARYAAFLRQFKYRSTSSRR